MTAGYRDLIGKEPFGGIYDVREDRAPRMIFSKDAWESASRVFGSPDRRIVESQSVIQIRDRFLGTTALFNEFRGRRGAVRAGEDPIELFNRTKQGCGFCGPRERGIRDDFGRVRHGRHFVAGPNWARLAPVSGLVIGYGEDLHNHLSISRQAFQSLIATAWKYIQAAFAAHPQNQFFLCFWNAGPKAAGSLPHAHLQVAGKPEAHFAWAREIAERCPAGYFRLLEHAHRSAGTGFRRGDCRGWVNLAPVRDREITVLSPGFREGAGLVHDIVRVLIGRGTNCFSLAAYLAPWLVSGRGAGGPYRGFPPVVWRVADRGDIRRPHSDIGGMELFGGVSVVSDSPWLVRSWLKEDLAP